MVAQDVTKAVTDDAQLSPLAMRAKETLGVERLRTVAAMGYSHGHEIHACEEADIDASVPKSSTSAHTQRGLFGTERCTSEPPKDGSRCPRGEELTVRLETTELGRHIRFYAPGAGRRCPLQEQCTRTKGGRSIPRWVDEPILDRMEERRKATPEIMPERKQLVEHPLGTIKHTNAQGDVRMKGLKNMRAAFSLSGLAYNLKHGINSLGVPQLLGAIR
jgi:hypothetical protein